jgi:hypothetical protein
MANSVRLESGWLFRQLESAEQRASNLPYWLTSPGASAPSERQTSSVQCSEKSEADKSSD